MSNNDTLLVQRYRGWRWAWGTIQREDYESLTRAQQQANYRVRGEFPDRETARAAYSAEVQRRTRELSRMAQSFVRQEQKRER